MKIQLTSLAALSSVLVFSLPVQAQTSVDLKSSGKAKISQLSGHIIPLRYFSRGLDKKIVQTHHSNPLISPRSKNIHLKNNGTLFSNKGLHNMLQEDPNAGSVDPGIFYAPVEPQTPAAIVLKPLKDLDPKMVIRPDDVVPTLSPRR